MNTSPEHSDSPKISVIVPVYKVEKYLSECIESVLAQTFTDFELILVDDGSPDNSGKICDEYAKKDSRIRVFHKENGGVSSARNLGIKNAKADYIAFLDSDDYWKLTFLEKMSLLSKKFPESGCCCCCWTAFSREGCSSMPAYLRGVAVGEMVSFDMISYAAKDGRLPIWTGAVLVKKSELEAVGGFDESLIIYEDYAVWFPLCLRSKVAYFNDVLSFYRQDSPIENKPRGKLPDLKKHWVSRLSQYDVISKERQDVKKYLDKFRIASLLNYRNIACDKFEYLKIFREISSENFTWKYWVAYHLPISVSRVVVRINFFISSIINRIK